MWDVGETKKLWDVVDGISNVRSQLANNTTNIDAICYPSDILEDDRYANSYTAFYISIHKEDKLANTAEVLGEGQRYTDAKQSAMQMTSAELGDKYTYSVKATGAGAAITTGKVIHSTLGSLGIASSGGAKAVADGVTLAGTAVAVGNTTIGQLGQNNLAFRQQKAFIVLPTPALTSAYSMSWDQEPMPLAAGIAEGIARTWDGDPQNPSMMGWLSNALTNGSDAMAAFQLKTPEFGGFLSRSSGYAVNPRKEQLFKDVNFREFNFNYTFAPRNQKEALLVKEIIQQFKFHAHPSLKDDGANMLYIYPSEFDIVHYYNNQPNPNLPKHATSILKNVSVNYAPNGHYNVNSDGFPSQIQLSLQFEEVALLTKKDIAQGY